MARPAVRWLSKKVSTAACKVGDPTSGVPRRPAAISSASPDAVRSLFARPYTSAAGISMDMVGSVAKRAAPSPASSTGPAAIRLPPDRVSTASTGPVHRRWTGVLLPTLPGVRRDPASAEQGSTLPFVLVCWTVAALMAFGAIAASDAFLEQQEVQSVCDGAALAAADQADEAIVYTDGVGSDLPLSRATAQAAVADQLADGGTRLDAWSAETDGTEVTVRCTRYVDIAFGWLFLGGEPLERTAVASARAPTI